MILSAPDERCRTCVWCEPDASGVGWWCGVFGDDVDRILNSCDDERVVATPENLRVAKAATRAFNERKDEPVS